MTSTSAPESAVPDPDRLFPPTPPLPAGAVLLHVGVHKTGTTAIQAALADARPELSRAGIAYPGKRQAQHRAAMAIIERTWGWKNKGGEVLDVSHFDKLAEQVQRHAGRVAVSSEFFCEADAETTVRVAEAFGRERTHVVVTLRNLGRLLPSSWQQYLKYGLTVGYEKWLRNVMENPGGSSMTPTFWRRNDHGAVVDRWAAAVGADHVTVIVLEDVDRSAMFRTFAQLLDVPEDLLVSRMDLTSNRSMTAAEAQLLIELNRRVKTDMQWEEYMRFVRRGVALGMVEGRAPARDEPRLETPGWALDFAAEQGTLAAQSIGSSGVRVLGDLEALARRVDGDSTGQERPTHIPIDAAVQAVMTVIEATRTSEEKSARELRNELMARTKDDLRLRWRMKRLRP